MPGQAQAQAQARDILRRCSDDVWGLFFIAVPAECRFSDVMRPPPPIPALTPFDASAQHLLPPQGNIYVLITLSLNKPKSSEMNMLMFVRP